MSQARGRYSGSRDSGQRQPRHVTKAPSNRQGQRYGKGAPTRDSSAAASIFKTRSFQFLVDAVGAENIALGLDSNLTRVAELMKGERFTPETAFHMETTLGLPHGFFDQPHPVLAPETIARLQSPLDFVQSDVQAEEDSEAFESPAPQVIQTAVSNDRSPEESEMRKKASGGSPSTARNRKNAKVEQPGASALSKGGTAKAEASAKASRQQSLALNEPAAIQEIRRANLHVLTARNGSKVKLGVVMGLTGSNMAHRLHGKKRMDDAEANRFTEGLGLPGGWLDTPRSEAEIPESVSRLLLPASRKKTSGSEHQPSTHPDGSPNSERVSPDVEPVLVGQDHADFTSSELASGDVRESNASVPAVTAQVPLAPVSRLHTTPHPIPSPTSPQNLDGIQPIAEALIKTLAGKARTGRLEELKALELLRQAVLL